MKKALVLSIVFLLLCCLGFCAKTKNSKVHNIKSTDGTEITEKSSRQISGLKNKDNSVKTHKKHRKEYQRYIKKINNATDKKRLKEQNLEFYNERLEIKKQKLEQLNSEVKKGENQE